MTYLRLRMASVTLEATILISMGTWCCQTPRQVWPGPLPVRRHRGRPEGGRGGRERCGTGPDLRDPHGILRVDIGCHPAASTSSPPSPDGVSYRSGFSPFCL